VNIALIVAGGDQSIKSFKSLNGMAYIDDELYNPWNGIRNIYNVPLPFDGWFVRWGNQGDLPKIQFDVIFLVIEDYSFHVDTIRECYPKAVIVGYTKEKSPSYHFPNSRKEFLSDCDVVATPYGDNIKEFLRESLQREIHSFPYPYDIEAIKKEFYIPSERRNKRIIVGEGNDSPHRGHKESLQLSQKIACNYGYEVFCIGHPLPWKEWLKEMADSVFCINLDPMPEIGQVSIECAALGVMHIGSDLDAASRLWRETTGNDSDHHLSMMSEYQGRYSKVCDDAYHDALSVYSYDSSRRNMDAMI